MLLNRQQGISSSCSPMVGGGDDRLPSFLGGITYPDSVLSHDRTPMEACAGAHFIARQLTAMGHTVKLISPQFVCPFVKGNKNDFVDAEAICEAASRPSMRFVSPKTEALQPPSVLHRLRESLVRDRTKTANQMHGFLLEFGISLPKGLVIMKRLASVLAEHELPVRLTVLLQRPPGACMSTSVICRCTRLHALVTSNANGWSSGVQFRNYPSWRRWLATSPLILGGLTNAFAPQSSSA